MSFVNCGVSFAVCSEDLPSSTWKSKRKWVQNEKLELVHGKKESHGQMKGVPSRSCIADETHRLLILSNTLRAMSLAADPFCDLAIEASIWPLRHRSVTPDRADLEPGADPGFWVTDVNIKLSTDDNDL
jgi:hypothetical protein